MLLWFAKKSQIPLVAIIFIFRFSLFLLITSLSIPSYASNSCVFKKAETRGWRGSEGTQSMDLHPQNAHFGVAVTTGAELHGTLYLLKSDGVKPYLAESATYDDKNKQFTVKINQSCHWSDGQPIVAQDFIEGAKTLYTVQEKALPSLDFILNGKQVREGKQPFTELGIKALDNYTLAYTLNTPPEAAKLILSLTPYAPLPSHRLKAENDYWSKQAPEQTFSGPFKVTKTDSEGIQLHKNKFFCDGWNIPVDKADIVFGKSFEKNSDLLLQQQFDLVGNLSARQRSFLLKAENTPEKYDLINSNMAAIMYLSLNPNSKALKDKNTREALRLAFDVNLMESKKLGILEKSTDTFSYRYPGYNPPSFPWPQIPYQQAISKARKLIETSGYSKQNPLHIKLVGAPLNEYQSIGAFIQSMYAQIHIDVEILMTQREEYFALMNDPNGDYDMQIYYWFADFPDAYNFLEAITQNNFHSADITDSYRRLLKKAETAKNWDNRHEYLAEAEKLLIDDGYLLPAGVPVRTWLKKRTARYDKAIRPTIRDLTHFECSKAKS